MELGTPQSKRPLNALHKVRFKGSSSPKLVGSLRTPLQLASADSSQSYPSSQISSLQGFRLSFYGTFRSTVARKFFYAVLWVLDYCKKLYPSSRLWATLLRSSRTAACCIVRTVMNWQNDHADPTCIPLPQRRVCNDRSNVGQGSVLTISFGESKSVSRNTSVSGLSSFPVTFLF